MKDDEKIKVTARPLAIGFVAFLVASLRCVPKKVRLRSLLVGAWRTLSLFIQKGLDSVYDL